MKKAILHVLTGKEKFISDDDMVFQSLPAAAFRFANPFIVVHHLGPKTIRPGTQAPICPHPHRGFAPVTFLIQGELEHIDSLGNHGLLKAGDTQWFFAGKGLLHDEIPSMSALKNGSTQELLQLWINVPKSHKFDEPTYQIGRLEDQPELSKQAGVSLKLISGSYDKQTGPLKSLTPVTFIRGDIAEGNNVVLTAKSGYWTLLYIINGRAAIDDENISKYQLVIFEKDHEEFAISAKERTKFLFMSAAPIDEPVAARGNFVMNSEEEIKQALNDYEAGKFGTL